MAAGRWNTAQGENYFAVGTTGAVAGRGADPCILDDPHSEQDVLENPKAAFDRCWKWYLSGPRQRLQPGGAILVCMTRWGTMDLTGQIMREVLEEEDGETWELIQLPAIMPSGRPLFPQFWPIEELLRIKARMPVSAWVGQYMQDPVSDEGAIIKREWWQEWPLDRPPACDLVVQAWDTAYSDKETANRSAMITWGEFCCYDPLDPSRKIRGIILLDAWAGRVNFPDLKQKAWSFTNSTGRTRSSSSRRPPGRP